MVASAFFALLLATSGAVVVRADAIPTEPGPGAVYKEGGKCTFAWNGDTDGKWSNMAVELMTGDNFQMVHLTTVVTGLDGNKAGTYSYDCPEVEPNSAIYFYQFTVPSTPGAIQWATRFTIAAASGSTVPPEHSTQTNGDAIPWGTGKLVDASSATPPPSGGSSGNSGNSTTTSGSSTGTTSSSSSSTSITATTTDGAPVGGSPAGGNTGSLTTLKSTKSLTSGGPGATGSSQNANTTNNGAVSVGTSRAMQAAFALVASASVFSFFL